MYDQRQRRKAGTEILMRLLEQSLELQSVVKAEIKKSKIIFLFHKATLKITDFK
jgi:hypothetical protein